MQIDISSMLFYILNMKAKRGVAFFFGFLFLSSLAFSQSLAELAKREKERRAKLTKKSEVITNAHLAQIKKTSAVAPQEIILLSEKSEEYPGESWETQSPYGAQEAMEKTEPLKVKEDVEEKWRRAKEYAELLTVKLNSLWQEFYSMDDMTSRDSIQREINDTFEKLQKALEEEEKARGELERTGKKTKI